LPVRGDVVEVAEGGVEMIRMLFADILDAEITDNEDKGNRTSSMFEVAWSGCDGSIAILGEVEYKTFVGKDTGLWEAIHAFVDLDVDITIDM
jgi:hypothetical protein